MLSNRWAGEYNNSGHIVYFYGKYKSRQHLVSELFATDTFNLNRWRFFKIPKYAYHGVDNYATK